MLFLVRVVSGGHAPRLEMDWVEGRTRVTVSSD
jgi:hypothetical protein